MRKTWQPFQRCLHEKIVSVLLRFLSSTFCVWLHRHCIHRNVRRCFSDLPSQILSGHGVPNLSVMSLSPCILAQTFPAKHTFARISLVPKSHKWSSCWSFDEIARETPPRVPHGPQDARMGGPYCSLESVCFASEMPKACPFHTLARAKLLIKNFLTPNLANFGKREPDVARPRLRVCPQLLRSRVQIHSSCRHAGCKAYTSFAASLWHLLQKTV